LIDNQNEKIRHNDLDNFSRSFLFAKVENMMRKKKTMLGDKINLRNHPVLKESPLHDLMLLVSDEIIRRHNEDPEQKPILKMKNEQRASGCDDVH